MRNYTMRYYLLLWFIFPGISVIGQSAVIKKVEQRNPITQELYVFPNIFIKDFSNKARKINNRLRSEILEVDPNTQDSKIFDRVWRTKKQSPTLTELTYEIIRNDQSILSLKISAEGCGAYCESWDRYFTFNLKTGNQLLLDSLINNKGLIKLSADFNFFRQTKINDKIKEIKDTLETNAVQNNKDDLNYYTEMLNLYKDCIESKITLEDLTDIKFSVNSVNLRLYSDRCSAHYNRNLDELWDFEYIIELTDWTENLTKYGRSFIHK